jgi:hypothetical protein
MTEPKPDPHEVADPVQNYKRVLQEVLDRRPSGTRQRLAQALERNRSFITQIANPSYSVPIPAPHVATIFEVCHFSGSERAAFLEAYRRAHPRSLVAVSHRPRGRHVNLLLPDFGSDEKNAAFDELLEHFLGGVARLTHAKIEPKSGRKTATEESHEKADQRTRDRSGREP